MENKNESFYQPIYRSEYVPEQGLPAVTQIQSSSAWGEMGQTEIAFNYVRVDYPKMHTHAHWEIFIVLSGTVVHEINKQSFSLQKGDACLIRPKDKHRLIKHAAVGKEHYHHINFIIDSDFITKFLSLIDPDLCERLLTTPYPLAFTIKPKLIQEIMKKTIAMQAHLPPTPEDIASCKLIVQDLIIQFLNASVFAQSTYPDWLSNFLVLLQDVNYFTIPVIELAKSTPYSYSRLARVFKAEMGISLLDYLTDQKINYAQSLLKNSDMTLLNIAMELQLTLSHFNKLFKKKTGFTPGKYRSEYSKLNHE